MNGSSKNGATAQAASGAGDNASPRRPNHHTRPAAAPFTIGCSAATVARTAPSVPTNAHGTASSNGRAGG